MVAGGGRRHHGCRYGQAVALYAYLQPDRYIRQLCHVWHPAYTFSRELAAAQRHDSALYHCHCALALFIFSLFPAVAIIISIVSMVGSLGATLSGVTFPVLNMYPLVRDASYLFPVRHYTEITQTMLYYGGGFIHLWPSAVILCIFPLLALAMLPHLRRAIISRKYENIR